MPEGSLTGTQTATKNYAVFNQFETMDTQASRVGIEPTRLSWCENLQILNAHELGTVPAPSPPFVSGGSSNVVKLWYGFVAGVDAVIMFRADGSMVGVTSAPSTVTRSSSFSTEAARRLRYRVVLAMRVIMPVRNRGVRMWRRVS